MTKSKKLIFKKHKHNKRKYVMFLLKKIILKINQY